MSTISLIWGILALVGMLVGFFPCLGSLNWLNIPFSGVGLIVSIVALAQATPEQKGAAVAGTVSCSIGVALGFIRLMAGGGIL
jgi:disulfide bond formation protein DsbB